HQPNRRSCFCVSRDFVKNLFFAWDLGSTCIFEPHKKPPDKRNAVVARGFIPAGLRSSPKAVDSLCLMHRVI
ncbi:hypothetical protein, partial [Pseudomonas corrugata]